MFKGIIMALALVAVSAFGFVANAVAAEAGKKVASQNATMQKDNPSIATRVFNGGTRIKMHFGETVIPGTLNDSETAEALIKVLPYTVKVNRTPTTFAALWIRCPIQRKMYTTVG